MDISAKEASGGELVNNPRIQVKKELPNPFHKILLEGNRSENVKSDRVQMKPQVYHLLAM